MKKSIAFLLILVACSSQQDHNHRAVGLPPGPAQPACITDSVGAHCASIADLGSGIFGVKIAGSGGGGGGPPTGPAGGDLSSNYPNPTVSAVNGSSVPAGGALTTGNTLQATGVSTLGYAPINLAGGAGFVTGVLPAANQAAQTLSGDVTGLASSSTTVRLNGASVPTSGALTTGNVLQVTGSSALSYSPINLAGGSGYVTGVLPSGNQASQSVGGDLSGTTASCTVAKIQNVSVPAPPGSGTTVLTDTTGALSWASGAPPNGSAGGDLSGTYPNPAVRQATGGVGGLFPITNPMQVDTAAGPVASVGAIRLPWVGTSGIATLFGEHDSASGSDHNIVGTSTDFGGSMQFGDDNLYTTLHGNYAEANVSNDFFIVNRSFGNTRVVDVGCNGGGCFTILDQANLGMSLQTYRANGSLNLDTGSLQVRQGGTLASSQVLLETFGPGGVTPNNVIVSSVTGGTLTLSAAQYIFPIIRLQGTLTSALTVVLPNQAGKWEFSLSQLSGIGVTNTVTFSSGSASSSAFSSLLSSQQVWTVYTYGSNTIDVNQ